MRAQTIAWTQNAHGHQTNFAKRLENKAARMEVSAWYYNCIPRHTSDDEPIWRRRRENRKRVVLAWSGHIRPPEDRDTVHEDRCGRDALQRAADIEEDDVAREDGEACDERPEREPGVAEEEDALVAINVT
jgi:hypothetical protein